MLTKEERKRFDGFWFRGKKRMKVRREEGRKGDHSAVAAIKTLWGSVVSFFPSAMSVKV